MFQKPVSRFLPPLMVESAGYDRTLLLRPLDVTDCFSVRKAIEESGEHLKRFMNWAHLSPTLVENILFFASWRSDYFSGRSFNFGIFDLKDGTFLGVIGLVPGDRLNTNCYEVGFWVAKEHCKQGVGIHALKTMIILCFHCFEVDRLEVLCPLDNRASRSLIEKCGFTLEGELKNILQKPTQEMIENGYSTNRNAHIFSLGPEDCANLSWAEEMASKIKLTPIQGNPFLLRERY